MEESVEACMRIYSISDATEPDYNEEDSLLFVFENSNANLSPYVFLWLSKKGGSACEFRMDPIKDSTLPAWVRRLI